MDPYLIASNDECPLARPFEHVSLKCPFSSALGHTRFDNGLEMIIQYWSPLMTRPPARAP